jgi:Tol biopolymer transport system component
MTRRLVLSVSLALLTLASVPALSEATFIPGPPGKIAFVSARPSEGVPAPNAGDAGSRIFVVDYPSGTPVQVTTQPEGATVRHRQPNWSPDHTRIAYAAGSGTTFALRLLDLRTGSQTQLVPAMTGLDRPTWSPDGSEIAFGAQGDLWVLSMQPGSEPVQVTDNAATTEERPVWSPDGNTLYYNTNLAGAKNLFKISPVAASSEEEQITTGGEDWQPSLSPDGTRLCFLRGPQNDKATLQLVGVNGGLVTPFSTTTGGSINCVWSPDGNQILYTQGVFSAGDLALRDLNGTPQSVPSSWKAPEHFDGNADWATNFSPECEDRSASIDVNKFTSVPLSCTDPDAGFGKEPPTPTPLESRDLEIVSQPAHGTIGGISDNETVIYTPVKDFRSTDSFTYTGSDGTSNADPATVTINVGQQGGGGDKKPPRISKIKVSPKRWRRGRKLASISAAPVGTTISFRLSEKARTTLSFQRKAKRKGKTKFVGKGKLTFSGRAGKNKVRFEGLIKKSKKLAPGTYRVVVSARDGAGNRARRTGPTFTIVPG